MAIFDPKTKVISGYQRTIEEKNRVIEKYYDEIGRLYYGQYRDMSVDVTKDINAKCDAVTDLYREIKDCEFKILFEKGLKLCPNCGKENMLAYGFCFACGTKFEEGSDKAPAEAKIEVPKAAPAAETVSEAVEEKAEEVTEAVTETAEAVEEKVEEKAEEIVEEVKETVEETASEASEAASETSEEITEEVKPEE